MNKSEEKVKNMYLHYYGGYKYSTNVGLYFLFIKKHHCYKCNGQLVRKLTRVKVHSESPEAKNYDFTDADGYLMDGYVYFSRHIFICKNCGEKYEAERLELLEISDNPKYVKKLKAKSINEREKNEKITLFISLMFIVFYLFWHLIKKMF